MSITAHDSVDCPTCDGDGYLGDPAIGAMRCRRCGGRGTLQVWELDEDEQDDLAREEGETEEEDADE